MCFQFGKIWATLSEKRKLQIECAAKEEDYLHLCARRCMQCVAKFFKNIQK